VFITGMRGSGLSYGEQTNCEHHLTRDIPNQVELTMSARGRKRKLISAIFEVSERPLWRKADIKPETPEIESENVRFTLGSGR